MKHMQSRNTRTNNEAGKTKHVAEEKRSTFDKT